MKIFKIVFLDNRPISCKEITEGVVFEGSHHYVHTKGRLIYAIVRADSETEVQQKVAAIIEEVKQKS